MNLGNFRTLKRKRENDQQTIKELQDEICSHKRRINESGDYADEELEEESRKVRICRHLGTREEPIVSQDRSCEIESFSLRIVGDVNRVLQ
jgi:hypothetical protein